MRSCATRSARGAWVDGNAVGEPLDRLDRDVLELVGDDVASVGEVSQHDAVVIVGARHGRGGLCGDALLVGREDVRVIAELGRGGREHAAELAAAEDADGRSGGEAASCQRLSGYRHSSGVGGDGVGLCGAPGFEALGQRIVGRREDRGRQKASVDRAGLADRERADRDAAGHLDDRE